jgi:transposase InsO family protein
MSNVRSNPSAAWRDWDQSPYLRVIITDGLDSYRGEYGSNEVVHIAGVGIQSSTNNNRVEKLHNTMREREKVMRNLKRARSAEKVLKGLRAYYNFVRPHMTLNGHTPAQEAAIPIQLGTNRWLDLIRQAARQRLPQKT